MAETTPIVPSQPPGLPFHNSSQNYINAQKTNPVSPSIPEGAIKMPDGRRNSQGEVLPSPTENWKPTFGRKQSWSQQDLKRQVVVEELEKKGIEGGQGTGFTEGGEGTRKV